MNHASAPTSSTVAAISGPVFRALIAEMPRGEPGAVAFAHSTIWRAIDRLRSVGDPAGQIPILEAVAKELHAARWCADRDTCRDNLARLTLAWLERAPIAR